MTSQGREEWYNDLNDFETNFFQKSDNPYRDVQKGSRSKATVDLRSIFEVLRRVIKLWHTRSSPPVNRRSDGNADIDMSKLTMRDLTITMHLVEILLSWPSFATEGVNEIYNSISNQSSWAEC